MPKFIGGHSQASFEYFLKKIKACRRTEKSELWSLDTANENRVFEAKFLDPVSNNFNYIEFCRISTRHLTKSPTFEEIVAKIHPNEIGWVDFFEVVYLEFEAGKWIATVVLYHSSGRLYAPG